MLLLTTTTDILQLKTSSALSTDWNCGYVDLNYPGSTLTPGSTEGNVATGTTTNIAAAPGASIQRQIKFISVVNNDASATQNVQIIKSSASTGYNVTGSIALAPGDSLQYVDTRGFFVINALGQEKVIGMTGPTGAAGAQGAVGAAVMLLVEDGAEGDQGIPGPNTLRGARFSMTVQLQAGDNNQYFFTLAADFAFTIDTAYYQTTAGTISAAIKINTTNVTGLSALALTSSVANTAATGANLVAAGNSVSATFSSNSSATYPVVTLQCTRLN